MQQIFEISTNKENCLIDITSKITEIINESGISSGIVNVYVQGATAAIMIQENWDDSVQDDVVGFLNKIIPKGIWLDDRQDGNGDAHIKAGIVGPSESIPIINGRIGLSQWQNIFLCEFDGPRLKRNIVVTIVA